MNAKRIFRPERPLRGDTNITRQQPLDEASWIWRANADHWGGAVFSETRSTPEVLARLPQTFLRFRRDFEAVSGEDVFELDVSADERFVLLLDGEEVGRGPHRGFPNRWHYHSYRIEGLAPGVHRLEAVCWQIGEHAPLAQLSVRGGFVLKASGGYDAFLTTGKAAWRVAPLVGTRMTDKGNSQAFGVGSQCEVRGTSILDEEPSADSWEETVVVRGPVSAWAGLRMQGWMLFPTPLPDMMRERKAPGVLRFANGGVSSPGEPQTLPPHTSAVFFWDLGGYYCAYPELRASGGAGARIRWDWAECLTGPDGHKGDRAAWEGLDMPKPFGDVFLPDGRDGACFTTPWWRCGKWCRISIETADQPLTIDSLSLLETRLLVKMEASFAGDGLIAEMQPVCERSLQMCMHETFFDCPYYEQQMYPGDSRVQYLVATLFGETGRTAVRNAIGLYDADRRENGMMPMNTPTRGTQESLPFTCCQAMMLGDLAWNHDDEATLRARFPGLCHTLMGMEAFVNADGLLGRTPGWNFVDWVDEWPNGIPPDGDSDAPNAEINLQYLHALLSGVRCAEALGEEHLAAHWRERANRLGDAIRATFWCPDKALFASDAAHTVFSQHSQALALLADVVEGDEAARCFAALTDDGGGRQPPTPLYRGSIYYRHYLFSTYFKHHRPDLFFKGLDFWRDCLDWHCATILEIPSTDSRSDCHGWGSHPLWHLHTGVAGVRSDAPYYRRVLVEPQPAHLNEIRSSTPTPHGPVVLDLHFDGDAVAGTVSLPPGVSGSFRWHGADIPLDSGRNSVVTVGNSVVCHPSAVCRFMVNPAEALGPVKPVNGVGQPPMVGALDDWELMPLLKEAGVPYSRLHDVGGWLGQGLFVDIPNLFPDFDADESDPANYRFVYTDSLMKALAANGVEPFFRLGVTIENWIYYRQPLPALRTQPPRDYAKWARVCEHVIRHYTEGWADGLRMKVEYWEIWNEPEGASMFGGPFEEYVRLYGVVASYLKGCFPHLKIGGYGSCGFYGGVDAEFVQAAAIAPNLIYYVECANKFLAAARDNGWPLDFFSFHSYSPPAEALRQVRYADRLLNEYGFTRDRTARVFNEWLPDPSRAVLGTARQASAIAAELIGLQNGPCDIACLYDARCREGIFSPLFNPLTIRPHKAYYALVAFNELRKRGTAVRVLCDGPFPGTYAAAAMPAPLREGGGGEAAGGSTSRGSLAVMLANPGNEEVPFKLEIADGLSRVATLKPRSGDLCGEAALNGEDAATAASSPRCRLIDDAHTWEEVPLPAALPPYSVLVVEIP